jgi:hypothetical protein
MYVSRSETSKNQSKPVLALPTQYLSEIITGFLDTLDGFKRSLPRLQVWLSSGVLKDCVARFTPYETAFFARQLRELYSPQFSSQPVPGGMSMPADYEREPFKTWSRQASEAWAQPSTKWPIPRPNFAIQTVEHSYEDYRKCDIPAYYHRLDSLDLRDARGEKVRISTPPSSPAFNLTTYFPDSTYNIVQRQVAALADPVTYDRVVQESLKDFTDAFNSDPQKMREVFQRWKATKATGADH